MDRLFYILFFICSFSFAQTDELDMDSFSKEPATTSIKSYSPILQEESSSTYYNKIRYINEREDTNSDEGTLLPLNDGLDPIVDERPRFEEYLDSKVTTDYEKVNTEPAKDYSSEKEDDTYSRDSEGLSKYWWILIGIPLLGFAYIIGILITRLLRIKSGLKEDLKEIDNPIVLIIIGSVVIGIIYSIFT